MLILVISDTLLVFSNAVSLKSAQVLRVCPGMICTYVELARCYSGLGMFDEAARVLHQCVSLQPQCSPALVAVSVSILIHHYCFVLNIVAISLLFYSNHAYFLFTLLSFMCRNCSWRVWRPGSSTPPRRIACWSRRWPVISRSAVRRASVW